MANLSLSSLNKSVEEQPLIEDRSWLSHDRNALRKIVDGCLSASRRDDALNAKQRSFRRWNESAAVCHVLLFALTCVAAFVWDAPYTAKFDRVVAEEKLVPPQYKQPTCANYSDPSYVFKKDEYETWLDCIADSVKLFQDDIEGRLYFPVATQLVEVRLVGLLMAFCGITALCHAALAWKVQRYVTWLENRLQPVRWLEYTVTSSIMILITATLSKVTEVYLLSFLVLANMFMNLCGGLAFEVLSAFERTLPRSSVEYSIARLTRRILYFCSWLVFVLTFVLIFDMFYAGIFPYFDFESGYLWKEMFWFIELINWVLFGCYLVFPVIQVLQIRKQRVKFLMFTVVFTYELCEKLYILASFLAKGALVVIYTYAAYGRPENS